MDNGHIEETNNVEIDPATGGAVMSFSYASDFPTLPDAAPASAPTAKQTHVWSRPTLSKSEVNITFRLASDERSNKVKSFGSTSEESKKAQAIATATKTRIELSESKDGELTVVVKGERAKAEEARARIIRDLQTQASREIDIPKDHHGRLIGKEGALLRNLEAETNCRIQIPNRDGPSSKITITGPREGIQRAAAHILAVSEREAKLATEHIVCPKNLVAFVRGPKNETYDRLTQNNGVKINIPPPHVTNEVISVTGEKDGVLRVAAEIRQIIESKKNVSSIQVAVARTQHRYIVGQSRSGIHDVLQKTGCVVEVPAEDSGSDQVTLIGNAQDLAKALALVIERASSVVTQSISAPNWLHKHLIGPKGATLTALVPNRNNVQIEFDNSNQIFLEGSPEEVKLAFEPLSKEVARLQMELAIEKVKVHPTLHRHVIGRGGSLISKIKDQHGVQITIPNEETNSDEIVVEGKKEGVKKAALEDAIKQLSETVDIKITVDPKYYKNFLARGAALVKEIQEQNGGVVISFPKNGTDSSEVSIRGSKQCVEAAKNRIEDVVEDYEKQITDNVTIPAQFHRGLLAGRGAKIHELQSKYNVSIRFPNNREEGSEGSDQVTVSGRDTKVEEAKEALLAMVPISKVIQLPVDMHRSIIGRGGETVRKLMQDYDVNISIPKDNSSEDITVTGQTENVDQALEALRGKLGEYEAQAEDRKLKQWSMSINVPTDYHQKIIGQRGATITALKEKYGVIINVPREDGNETITIQGYEEKANECAAAIEEMISELRSMFTQEISLDARYHPRLIGQRGKNLKKVMEDYRVEIRLPRQGAEDPNLVVVAGKDENDVYDCIDHLRAEEEEFLLDNVERTQYMSPRQQESNNTRHHQQPTSVQMKGAPWQLDLGSSEQFPDMGPAAGSSAAVGGAGAWGSSRRW
eukprot:NP_001129807.1 ViGiLN homolog [Caenorhabditis elegans]